MWKYIWPDAGKCARDQWWIAHCTAERTGKISSYRGCKLAAVLQNASQFLMLEKVLETNKFSQYVHNFDNIFESFMIFTIKDLQL